MCAELCSQKQYKTHDGVKWLCEHRTYSQFVKLRIPSQISMQTVIKHVLPAKVRAMKQQ